MPINKTNANEVTLKKQRNKEVLAPPQHSEAAPPLLVDKTDARYYLGGICLKTLSKLIKAKKLPTVKVLGRTMIPYHAVISLAKKGTRTN